MRNTKAPRLRPRERAQRLEVDDARQRDHFSRPAGSLGHARRRARRRAPPPPDQVPARRAARLQDQQEAGSRRPPLARAMTTRGSRHRRRCCRTASSSPAPATPASSSTVRGSCTSAPPSPPRRHQGGAEQVLRHLAARRPGCCLGAAQSQGRPHRRAGRRPRECGLLQLRRRRVELHPDDHLRGPEDLGVRRHSLLPQRQQAGRSDSRPARLRRPRIATVRHQGHRPLQPVTATGSHSSPGAAASPARGRFVSD